MADFDQVHDSDGIDAPILRLSIEVDEDNTSDSDSNDDDGDVGEVGDEATGDLDETAGEDFLLRQPQPYQHEPSSRDQAGELNGEGDGAAAGAGENQDRLDPTNVENW